MLLKTGQKQPAYSALNRVSALLTSAAALYQEAEQSAAAGTWDDAIAKMQEASSFTEQAVRASGYTY